MTRHLIGSARDIVLAHAKDPQFDKVGDDAIAARELLDFAELHSSFIHWMWNLLRKGQRPDDFPELRESLMPRSLYFWGFYQRYISWLKRIEYTGAVVMHGLDESVVDANTAFLQSLNQWASAER